MNQTPENGCCSHDSCDFCHDELSRGGSPSNDWKNAYCSKHNTFFERIIRCGSNTGDLILDCFAGSGTTSEACWNLDRDYILVERDPVHFGTLKNRVETFSQRKKLLHIHQGKEEKQGELF